MSAPRAQLLQCCDFCHEFSVVSDSVPLPKVSLLLSIPKNPSRFSLRDAGATTLDICPGCAMRLRNLLATELNIYEMDDATRPTAVKWKTKEDPNE